MSESNFDVIYLPIKARVQQLWSVENDQKFAKIGNIDFSKKSLKQEMWRTTFQNVSN